MLMSQFLACTWISPAMPRYTHPVSSAIISMYPRMRSQRARFSSWPVMSVSDGASLIEATLFKTMVGRLKTDSKRGTARSCQGDRSSSEGAPAAGSSSFFEDDGKHPWPRVPRGCCLLPHLVHSARSLWHPALCRSLLRSADTTVNSSSSMSLPGSRANPHSSLGSTCWKQGIHRDDSSPPAYQTAAPAQTRRPPCSTACHIDAPR